MTTTPVKREGKRPRKAQAQQQSQDAQLAALQEAIVNMRQNKDQIATLSEEVGKLEADAIALMKKMNRKSVSFQRGKRHYRGTLVAGSRMILDEARLKKRVGLAIWRKITSLRIDQAKLEAAIANGTIKSAVVADCTSEVPNKEYVRVT